MKRMIVIAVLVMFAWPVKAQKYDLSDVLNTPTPTIRVRIKTYRSMSDLYFIDSLGHWSHSRVDTGHIIHIDSVFEFLRIDTTRERIDIMWEVE